MTSPDLSIPDMESETKGQAQQSQKKNSSNNPQEAKVDQKRMKMIQLS